ncbi:BRIX domain-containing [Cryptosporidium sp. chipmunk genotype I]|uniref:BRIX domain-containing n=1 Tax=Cryptosporidium sp. chipmunk genotype I TaxID=1280935 RepID=UPI00351A2EF1|nr:BRIX domain-containing [Cryptosporidium sp. chipmunk genotype I]
MAKLSSGKVKGSKKGVIIKRESQVNEETKRRLIIKGSKCKENIQNLLKDLNKIFPKAYTKIVRGITKGELITSPWVDPHKMEQLSYKHGSSISIFANSSKKHPFRLIFTRYYDSHILDMYEFNVLNYKGISPNMELPKYGSKPIVICQGAPFESDDVYKSIREMFFDTFSGPIVRGSKLFLKGFDHLILVTAYESDSEKSTKKSTIIGSMESKIHIDIRSYLIHLNRPSEQVPSELLIKSDQSLVLSGSPRAILSEIGLQIKMELVKHQIPDKSILKSAMIIPREIKPKKVKNITTNVLGESIGRIHVGKQDLSTLNTPHAGILSKINRNTE